ncbi:MAG TPA: RtcB family protein [Actinomycetota bacterium]|nr:RtcB family protein [Actinomycetota bacterium]
MTRLSERSPHVWELAPVGGMRVPGRVFASKPLVDKAASDKALDQVANVAHLPGIVGFSFAMPDIHWGYGFPIGGVCATDVEDGGVISPGGVGFDISCGVRLVRTDIEAQDLLDRRDEVVRHLSRIPRGVGGSGLMPLSHAETRRVLAEGAPFAVERGFGRPSDLEVCEDHGHLEEADPGVVSQQAVERGAPQLGSLGAGNHFLEVQVIDEIHDERAAEVLGLRRGQVAVMIHCGSRGVGHQVCTDEVRAMDRAMRSYGIEVPDRQLACVPVASPEGQRYLAGMAAAANYGRANRQVITHGVREAFASAFGVDAASLGMDVVYDVSHNLAKIERYEVDGRERKLCVHRKGATRAFGPGHPELPDRYREIGQPVMVPGSMGTASYVLVGTPQGRDIAWWSTCHGAGRTMSRKQATKQMHGRDLQRQLAEQGIVVVAQQTRLLSEEAPYAYKDVSEVVEVCERVGLSRKVARLRPVAVVKG